MCCNTGSMTGPVSPTLVNSLQRSHPLSKPNSTTPHDVQAGLIDLPSSEEQEHTSASSSLSLPAQEATTSVSRPPRYVQEGSSFRHDVRVNPKTGKPKKQHFSVNRLTRLERLAIVQAGGVGVATTATAQPHCQQSAQGRGFGPKRFGCDRCKKVIKKADEEHEKGAISLIRWCNVVPQCLAAFRVQGGSDGVSKNERTLLILDPFTADSDTCYC